MFGALLHARLWARYFYTPYLNGTELVQDMVFKMTSLSHQQLLPFDLSARKTTFLGEPRMAVSRYPTWRGDFIG